MTESLSERVLADAIREAIVRSHSVPRRAGGDWPTDEALRANHEAESAARAVVALVVADRLARAEVHDDGPQGMTYVWLCSFCGQPLTGPDDVCNSAAHVRPDGSNVGTAIRSIDLATLADRVAEYKRGMADGIADADVDTHYADAQGFARGQYEARLALTKQIKDALWEATGQTDSPERRRGLQIAFNLVAGLAPTSEQPDA